MFFSCVPAKEGQRSGSTTEQQPWDWLGSDLLKSTSAGQMLAVKGSWTWAFWLQHSLLIQHTTVQDYSLSYQPVLLSPVSMLSDDSGSSQSRPWSGLDQSTGPCSLASCLFPTPAAAMCSKPWERAAGGKVREKWGEDVFVVLFI